MVWQLLKLCMAQHAGRSVVSSCQPCPVCQKVDRLQLAAVFRVKASDRLQLSALFCLRQSLYLAALPCTSPAHPVVPTSALCALPADSVPEQLRAAVSPDSAGWAGDSPAGDSYVRGHVFVANTFVFLMGAWGSRSRATLPLAEWCL